MQSTQTTTISNDYFMEIQTRFEIDLISKMYIQCLRNTYIYYYKFDIRMLFRKNHTTFCFKDTNDPKAMKQKTNDNKKIQLFSLFLIVVG